MSKTISISIPYTVAALQAAATMFQGMAEQLGNDAPPKEAAPEPVQPDPAIASVVTEAPAPEPKAEEVFKEPNNVIPMSSAVVPPVTEETELDSAGIPWDERIHASTKTKDKNGKWKLLRGIDRETFLPQVEAELRAAVSGAPAADTTQEPAAATVQPSQTVTTFAQLVTTVTAQGISEEQIDAALSAVNVANFALLGAQPDLVPVVAAHLGL